MQTLFDRAKSANDLAFEMNIIARALNVVGNRELAERIGVWADACEEIGNDVRSATSLSVSEGLRRAQESTANMMTALIGGLEIGAKANGTPHDQSGSGTDAP